MPENIVQDMFFVFLMIFGGPGPIREISGATLESDLKKTSKDQIRHPLFRRLFGVVLLKNQILGHLCGSNFLAYFLYRF